MSALWSSQQHEWLKALGHDVLMYAGAGSTAAGSTGAGTEAPAREPVATSAAAPRAMAEATSARSEVAASAASPHLPESPLLRALARAAGRSTQDQELLRALPDLATLRGNPRGRRALWPQLRALRKARRE